MAQRSSSLDNQIDKITEQELNMSLREKIGLSYSHLNNTTMHITDKERAYWNSKLDLSSPVATRYQNGLMGKEDRIKLDGIAEGATNYKHPKSGIVPGSYLTLTVDDAGHAVYGENPSRLNVTCADAEKLGGEYPNKYAKLVSPVFMGTPTCPTAAKGTNSYQMANCKFVMENAVPAAFSVSNVPPSDTRMAWIDLSTNTLNYFYNNKWNPICAVYSTSV